MPKATTKLVAKVNFEMETLWFTIQISYSQLYINALMEIEHKEFQNIVFQHQVFHSWLVKKESKMDPMRFRGGF